MPAAVLAPTGELGGLADQAGAQSPIYRASSSSRAGLSPKARLKTFLKGHLSPNTRGRLFVLSNRAQQKLSKGVSAVKAERQVNCLRL